MNFMAKLVMFLIYGVLIGIPAGLISTLLVSPLTLAGNTPLLVLGTAIGFIVLGWWARLIVKKIHIFGG